MIYIIIFFAKLIEVTFATLRMVLITKGMRLYGAFLAIFEIVIWVILTGTVVNNIIENPLKIVAYALGFSAGCFIGSWIEEKLALGITNINVITTDEAADNIISVLNSNEIAYTIFDAHGKEGHNKLIMLYVTRNKKRKVFSILNSTNEKFFVTTNESVGVLGGYNLKR